MLYIIPTPIGNLADISERAKILLSEVDFIIAENPSTTHKLLQLLKLPKKEIVQFAEHNETKVLATYTERLQSETACLVSDAGTPGISDPGFRLVREARQHNISVISIPGPSSAITALAGSGLPTDRFLFVGFLPKTEAKVVSIFQTAENCSATLIAHESPQRLQKTISFLIKHFPHCQIAIARELTKVHEEYLFGIPQEISELLQKKPTLKGEITLLASFK